MLLRSGVVAHTAPCELHVDTTIWVLAALRDCKLFKANYITKVLSNRPDTHFSDNRSSSSSSSRSGSSSSKLLSQVLFSPDVIVLFSRTLYLTLSHSNII